MILADSPEGLSLEKLKVMVVTLGAEVKPVSVPLPEM